MATAKSEAVKKYMNGEATIRMPTTDPDLENRIDHYAVLSQIIDGGIQRYLSEPEYYYSLSDATTQKELISNLKNDVQSVILATLQDQTFAAHHDNLVQSQTERHALNRWRHSKIENLIIGGVGTFTTTFSSLFNALSRDSLEVATHPDNWRIIDRLAKLNINAMFAYTDTYLDNYKNWSAFRSHLVKHENGSMHFLPGFPKNAVVTEAVGTLKPMLETKDFDVSGSQPLMTINEIEGDGETLGCPVTFQKDTIKKLWQVYASEAYRIATTPAIQPTGDTEAFRQ